MKVRDEIDKCVWILAHWFEIALTIISQQQKITLKSLRYMTGVDELGRYHQLHYLGSKSLIRLCGEGEVFAITLDLKVEIMTNNKKQ